MGDDGSDGVGLLPSHVTLSKTCSNSDLSTMSASRSDRTDKESMVNQMMVALKEYEQEDGKDENSNDGIAEGDKYTRLKENMRKRTKAFEEMALQLQRENKRRKTTITVEKQVTRVEDLPETNTLALDKQISLINFLRDVIFTGLKYVTKDTIERGAIIGKIMENLQLASDFQKKAYRLHLEITVEKKLGSSETTLLRI